MTVAAPSSSTKGQINGWHVLAAMVAFFAFVAAVDAFFIVKAYRSFSGQVAANPYEAGLEFNRTLSRNRRAAALGWTATVEADASDTVVVRLTDKAGRPLSKLSLVATLERPATENGRQILSFKPVGDGRYEAAARLDGAWDLRATARRGDEEFGFETRLVRP